MTRKDYIKFANLIKDLHNNEIQLIRTGINLDVDIKHYENELINGLISIFKTDNNRFDEVRFKDYISK